MWRCECGCLDGIERKWKQRDPEDPEHKKEIEKSEMVWRPRQAFPVQVSGKAQIYASAVLCTECLNALDLYFVGTKEWTEFRVVDKALVRMEIEGRGTTLDSGWEAKRDESYALLVKMKAITLEWIRTRRAAVLAENQSKGADEHKINVGY
jgi:hypothetical protein